MYPYLKIDTSYVSLKGLAFFSEMSSLDITMTFFWGPGWLSASEARLAPLLFFSALPQIETALPQIETALPQIEINVLN